MQTGCGYRLQRRAARPYQGICNAKMDGGYTIVVNLKLNDESRRRAVEHELCHIFSNDSQSPLPVILIEKAALEFTERKKNPSE